MSRIWSLTHRLLLILLPLSWLPYIFNAPNGLDFYPLYFAAQQIAQGISPYGTDATNALIVAWDGKFAHAGVAYPLPLILLVVPLTQLAFPVAALLWTLGGFVLSYACVILAREQSTLRQHPAWYQIVSLLLPFTYWPFYQGINLGQATLIMFGLATLLVLSVRRHQPWLVAICVVLLALKPQNGLIFALYGLYWLYRNHKRALTFAILLGAMLLGISFVMQPDWINAWTRQVATYNSIVSPTPLLPLGFILLVVVWRLQMVWWAKVAIFQVILFPFSSMYSFLPLLLAWCAFSPILALIGTSLSWLWIIFPVAHSLKMIWLLLLIPLILTAIWDARPQQLRRKVTA